LRSPPRSAGRACVPPGTIPAALPAALVLAIVGAATKVGTGWMAARRAGIGRRGRVRAGVALIARGEFSIVIAGIAVAGGAETRPGAARGVLRPAARGVRPARGSHRRSAGATRVAPS
jgi:CPA2 family monovalent cation:H+ antiporter-2